jgi:hypothetical protein
VLSCTASTPDSSIDSALVAAAHQRASDRQPQIVPYDIVRQWQPNNEPNGYGADLIISPDANESDVIDLVRWLARGHDPVSINIYLREAAYEDSRRPDPSEVAGDGFIGAYVKNLSSGGAYQGANEFRWAQERGRFAYKTGGTTKF